MDSVKVTFQPEGKNVYVLKGTKVLEAAGRAGIIIESSCGGKGICSKCRVEITEGELEPAPAERELINTEVLSKEARLACQSKIYSSCVINIPKESRRSVQHILTSRLKVKKDIKPSIRKIYLELPKPTLENHVADLEMIKKAIRSEFTLDIYIIRQLSKILRESDFKVTCVFSNNELISIEKGDTTKSNYGVAFDVGTTTLVATLLDANTGEELAVCARMNPQVIYGDDVIARINLVINEKDGLENLHHCLVKEMNEMVNELIGQAGIKKKNIYKITTAGNSAMGHILAKISPENLGSIPFSLTMKEGIEIKAQRIGININSDGSVYLLPNIGGFVGGDSVAAILYTQTHKSTETKLIIDIGTNGEIILGNEASIVAASTAAGPAFEGARISQGMRASKGAIEKIVISKDVEYNVIGNVAPTGICGTGLIDVAAEMSRKGIVDRTGRIVSRKALEGKISDELLKRIIEHETYNDFLIADKPPIYITQQDIRELQLAKAAISAGIKILEDELGIEDKDIDEILLAGAFGNFIRRNNVKQIGLIPDLPSEKIKFIGNAASSGAELVLLSSNSKEEVEHISRHTQYIQLSTKSDFNKKFADEMFFKS
jgi:uncharacterized 2Fe-2S/4Fe-4S cluster protein (DUF4445 family)